MQNGDNFQSTTQFPYGYPATQAVIILPLPDTQNVYLMLDGVHKDISTDIITERLRYSVIDMSFNNGLGKVTQKKATIENSTDTLNVGLLTAVRHGNGKDWWVITTKYESNIHRKYLVTGNGIQFHDDQIIGDTVYNGVGYAAFSPDGKWFARYFIYGTTSNPKMASYLYRFDRCTGQLSSPLRKKYYAPDYRGGVAFSPNSRFLYVANYTKIYQYDMEASDVLASEQLVAQYDSFLDDNGVPTRFFGLWLAPDNKIYGTVPGFNTRYLHVIDQPNLPGDSCNVIQHGILLPVDNIGTLPNVPYFRLYATDTPCDSMVSTKAPHRLPDIRMQSMPNPASERILVQFGQLLPVGSKLVFSDVAGKAIFNREVGGMSETSLDVSDIHAGVYLITLRPSGLAPLSIKAVITH
ncbi:MAG: hypothetical protein EPGJADBJ_05421 [Saprospiraceae bacterium]|nr:hypothetical protein [Saprospiraceae bacterium]